MHDELADPGNQATHNQLNAATPQLQTAVAGVNDKTSNDLLPAQTSADQGSLKSDDPNTPALPPGPGPNVSDAEAALLGLDGGWRAQAQGAAGDVTTPPVTRWLVRRKDCHHVTGAPGATGYPEWLEAAAKLLQAHTVLFSGGDTSSDGGASSESPDDFFERDDATSSTDTDPVQQLMQKAAEVFDVSHGDESTAPAWLVIAAFEAVYNMNRDDFRFNVPIADAFPPRGSSLARVPAELPPAENALMPDDFCFNVPIVHAFPSLGSSLAQGVAEVLPAAAGADESMLDGSTELDEVQVEAKTAVQPDEAGGVADRLPYKLVGANHVFGAPMQKVFSPLSFFETAYLDLDMPGEEFNALLSFEEAVDKLHVADADAARPATSASAGLTSATARPPGRCFSLRWLSPVFTPSPHSCCSLSLLELGLTPSLDSRC